MLDREPFVLAIQKPKEEGGPDKGRLAQPSKDLLVAAGFRFEFVGRNLECVVRDSNGQPYPLRLVLQHNREIARFVAEENADGAIVGRDRFLDVNPRYRGSLVWSVPLSFPGAVCSFQLGAYENSPFVNLTDSKGNPRLAGLRDVVGQPIATEHPNALALYAEKLGLLLDIHAFTGGVESSRIKGEKFPFIADLTVTGGTMMDNGYIPQETIFRSKAGLIRRRDLSPKRWVTFQDIRTALLRAQKPHDQEGDHATSEGEITIQLPGNALLLPARPSLSRVVNRAWFFVTNLGRPQITEAS